MGFKPKECAKYVVKALELPLTANEFHEEIIEIYKELFPCTKPMPGNAQHRNMLVSDVHNFVPIVTKQKKIYINSLCNV